MSWLLWRPAGWSLLRIAEAIESWRPGEALRLCGLVARAAGADHSLAGRRLRAAAATREARLLGQLGRPDLAITANDAIIYTHGASTDEELRTHVAWALVNKGYDLDSLGRVDEAIATYQRLSEYVPFAGGFAAPVAQGLMNWALALDQLGRHLEETQIYKRIRNELAAAEDPATQHLFAWALLNHAAVLFDEGRFDEAIGMCDAVLSRWGTAPVWSTSARMQEAVARAFRQKAQAEAAQERFDQAIRDADAAIDHFIGAGDAGISEEIASAMLVKAGALEKVGRGEAALETYNEIVRRYGRSRHAKVRAVVLSSRRLREGLEADSHRC